MKKIQQSLLVSLAALSLSACGDVSKTYQIFSDHSQDYLQADATPPLQIPPGYSSSSVEDYYPVPNAAGNMAQTTPQIIPPNIDPKLVPKPRPWILRLIPHAHMPWEAPENNND